MGKLTLNNQMLAQLKSFASRGAIEDAVISAILDKVRVAELSAAAEAANAIVVTGTCYELDGTLLPSALVHLRSVPVTGGKGLATVVGDQAVLTGGNQTFAFNEVSGETLVIEGSDDGGATWAYFSRVMTFSSTGSAWANIAALLGDLNTAARWDGAALPTEFIITNTGDALVITMADSGDRYAIRIGDASTAIGVTTDADLLYTALDQDIGDGAHVIMGDGTVDLLIESDLSGVFEVSIANDVAEKNLVEVMLDDGLVELLELSFA